MIKQMNSVQYFYSVHSVLFLDFIRLVKFVKILSDELTVTDKRRQKMTE